MTIRSKAVLVLLFAGFPAVAQERAMVPLTIDGETVRLATITHKPAGAGPFPILIFHHGSTGRGIDPSIFANVYEPRPLIDWFAARGWAVAACIWGLVLQTGTLQLLPVLYAGSAVAVAIAAGLEESRMNPSCVSAQVAQRFREDIAATAVAWNW